MNSEIVPPIKRRRGRPRKKNTNVTAINKFPTFTPQTSYPAKRKAVESTSPEIEIISLNGLDPKKTKPDDDQPKRLQPPRRARFTESYGGTADVVLVSASESESESDSDCSPIPSPIPKVRTKEEQEEYDTNIQSLRKVLGDEEMKLVLLRKLRESQKSSSKRGEANGSPLPTALVSSSKGQTVTLKGGVQIQPLPSKQLLSSNKYLTSKRDTKPDVISNSSTILLKTSSSSQFKPIQSSFKSHQQPYNKPIKQEAALVSSSSMEQLNSNHLNQYPLLKNLSNQITITAVPPPTSSSNGSSRHQQQQQQQQQLQGEKNDAETLQQRQAAAKLALRKQLEKTLLQIPLPKPPPLKINFFPNANSMEFLCLLGLDFVVDFLTRSKRHPLQKDPLRCAQCATDFTCAWKWKEVDRDGVKVYDAFCEACITSNVRKALKAQHTNNLKSAFLKALQQEKEIDRLTIHTMPKSSPSSHSLRETPKSSHRHSGGHGESSHSNRRHAEGASAGRQPSPAHQGQSSAFSIPKGGSMASLPPYIPKSSGGMNHSSSGINHAALAQLSKLSPQYQSLLQAQAQQLLAAGVPLHPGVLSLSPFMTPLHHGRGKGSSGDGGRSGRHYRSDRVQSPNIPHSSSSWKA